MLELINSSTEDCDICNLPGGTTAGLTEMLKQHTLDGVELMVCDAAHLSLFPKEYIHGIHLWFYPSWLHFWWGNKALLAQDYTEQEVRMIFGASREEWLERYRRNFHMAAVCGAKYVVFHVAHAGRGEIFSRRFFYDNRAVVEGTIEVIQELVSALPADCELLYENLWWPGLTFRDPALAARLIERTPHERTGFVLDTGHLMNTDWSLRTEEDGVCYILQTIERLAAYDTDLAGRIHTIHLHQSLSGTYARRMQEAALRGEVTEHPMPEKLIAYILSIDEHRPFCTPRVRDIIDRVQPRRLVHEFIPQNASDWVQKITTQKKALQGGL